MTEERPTMAPLDRGGAGDEVDWETLRESVLGATDVLAVAEECGFRPVGESLGEWVGGRAFDRADNSPSASLNVETGWYHDHACDEGMSLFDVMVEAGLAKDYWDAFKQLAERAGVEAPGGGDRADRPAPPAVTRPPKPPPPPRELKEYETDNAAVDAVLRNLPIEGKALVYGYEDAAGGPAFGVVKGKTVNGDKFVRQISRRGKMWVAAGPEGMRPLYDLPALLTAGEGETVYVPEGEKDAETLKTAGLLATTSAGGAKAAKKTDWTPLAGRDVAILPDHDDAGRGYAEDVEQRLLRLDPPAIVRVVDSGVLFDACEDEGLVEEGEPPKGWDVSDAAGDPAAFADDEAGAERREALRCAIEKAAAETPSSESDVPADPLAYRPFPVRFLPEHLEAFVRDRAGAMGCDPALIAVPTLAVCAGAVGATRRAEVKGGWTEPTPVFAATIGLSGGHKSPAADCVMDVVREMQRAEKRRYDAATAAYKLDHRAWEVRAKRVKHASPSTLEPEPEKPVLRTLFLSDVTTEALMRRLVESGRGLFCFVDELAGLFGMMDRYAGKCGGDQAKWLEFHGGRDARVDRKTGDDPVLYVPDACVSLFGTTQPAVVRRLLTADMVESGLAPRFCFAWPPSRPAVWSDAEPDPALREGLRATLEALWTLEKEVPEGGDATRPVIIPLSPAAKRLFRDYYDRIGREIAAAGGAEASAFSKARGNAVRLALIHQLAAAQDRRGRPTPACVREVGPCSMRAGIELAEWFRHEYVRVLALLNEDRAEAALRRTREFVERNGGAVTARDLHGAYRRLTTAADAEKELEALVEAGLGRWRTRPTTNKGGRPTREFVLNGAAASRVCEAVTAVEVRPAYRRPAGAADPFARPVPAFEDVPPAAAA